MPALHAAVILVAGVGSRLRPLTDERPKALVDIGGQSILGRALALLAEHGVKRAVLATGYRQDAVRAATKDAPLEVSYCPNDRYDTTQNSVSLALCREAVGGEAFYKLDGDVVFQPEVLARLDESELPLAVAIDSSRRVDEEAMKVELAGPRLIASFGKGIALESAAGETLGIERIGHALVAPLFDALDAAVSQGRTDLYYEDVYAELIRDQLVEAEAVDVADLPWTEVDDHDDLAVARQLLKR